MNYYNKHASEYIQNTKDANMKEYYEIFESYLKPNFKIDKLWFNEDKHNRDVKWLNVILKK